MGENTGKITADSNDELVEITFTNQSGTRVTRRVWPEVARFVNSRAQATIDYRRAQTEYERASQRYVWAKEDEWYADPANLNAPNGFDSYTAQREFRRTDEGQRLSLREAEQRYYDFLNGGGLRPEHRNNQENPNSWEILRREAEAAGHKVIVWIVDNTLEYENEARMILNYLPSNSAELWEIAKEDNNMCEVFDRFMRSAERANVLGDLDAGISASVKEQLALRSYIRRTYGIGYAREIMTHVDRVVRAEREAADKRLAEARAEWQGLDEAWRSERSRRAAATRRANAEAAEGVHLGDVPAPVNLVHPDREAKVTQVA